MLIPSITKSNETSEEEPKVIRDRSSHEESKVDDLKVSSDEND